MELRGIDVSNFHGKIHWDKVKEDGIEFAIIRAGWYKNNIDPRFRANIEEAIKQDIKIGVYWYIYAKDESEARANAKKCYDIIAPYLPSVKMGVWGVWSYDSDKYYKNLTKAKRTQFIKVFCDTLSGCGCHAGYFVDNAYLTKISTTVLADYPQWLALYATSKGNNEPLMWQYQSSGKVSGIIPRVDMNICYDDINQYSNYCDYKKYPKLTKGSVGDKVTLLQSMLSEKGFLTTGVTGVYDPETYQSVKEFQTSKELTVDGIVGPKTWSALMN